MQPTCETCGRALSAPGNAAPGAPVEVTCTCGHTQALRVVPRPPPRRASLAVAPLPSPRGGESIEVDPWSLPPPEDGYENLVLDDGRSGAAPSAPAEPVEPVPPSPAPAPPREAAEPSPGRDEPAAAGAPGIARSRLVLAGAVAAVVVLGALAAALLRARSADGSPASAGVRVTVTQDAPWAAPPLAPVDPSYVERRRPESSRARPEAPPPPPRAPASRGASRSPATAAARTAIPASTAAPAASAEPIPNAAAAPEEEPAPEPPAPAPVPEIPLPPPPALASASPPARAPAVAVRPPVLRTQSCVEDALRVPRGLEGRLPREVVLRVDVGEDGLPGSVSAGEGVDPRLASALAAAVRTCRFAPGTGADGRPAAQPTAMRVRFAP